MSRLSDEEVKKKWDKFAAAYVGDAKGNGALAARMAGYAESRAPRTAYNLLNENEYVKNKIATYQSLSKEQSTDSVGSIKDIFETVGPTALKILAEKAKTDVGAAKQFMELKLKFEKKDQEVLGDFEGCSTAEIIRRIGDCIQEASSIKARALEAFGIGDLPDGSDVSGI